MGRPPSWVGQRLIVLAVTRWPEFHGGCLLHGLDPLALPLPSLLNVIYAWWIRGATVKDVVKFDADLWAPPAYLDPSATPGWSDEETLEAFTHALADMRRAGKHPE